ncbi:Sir2 family NAD-dependent protein deacetylase [Gleimia hominis]|uniref:protein acetyllysine N-acetyltransferase n=1 Tax=Gleimia hominis TaxID=595468 RepID=A0ABU3I8A8_9ACTO|nr:Sir2 family NAD-dependent protein deacetylase [Gleimia hominis]MDT3766620.1 Sir2 family NAD-dependent protein deacetylase [Gleimia hominis]
MTSTTQEAGKQLADLMRGRTTMVVAGAGMSTDAGLPDYRGTGSSGTPTVDYDLFMSDKKWQRWVWQRNQETWRAVTRLQPTPAHRVVAKWQAEGLVNGVATQNVDGLDARAGIKDPMLLHGTFALVNCTGCGSQFPREDVDEWMRKLNPNVVDDPDPAHCAILAEADEAGADASTFEPAPCPKCGGVLKPDVVFFGEMLPMEAMSRAYAAAAAADVVLALGTSLLVGTGLWVVSEGLQSGADFAIVNLGPTAADNYATLRIEGNVSDILQAADQAL